MFFQQSNLKAFGIAFCAFLLVNPFSFGQSKTGKSLEIHIASGTGTYMPASGGIVGSSFESDFSGTGCFQLGVDYFEKKSEYIETGFGLYLNTVDYNYTNTNTWQSKSYDYSDRLFYFSLPIQAKLNLLNYFYLKGNISLIYTTYKDYSYGYGYGLEGGVQYIFGNSILASLGYSKEFVSFIPSFSTAQKSGSIQKDLISFCLGYKF